MTPAPGTLLKKDGNIWLNVDLGGIMSLISHPIVLGANIRTLL